MVILAGKITGEETELGLFTHKSETVIDSLVANQTFNTKDYERELPKMVETFLNQNYDRQEKIYGACFGVAGKVDKSELAQIDRPNLKATLISDEFRSKLPYKGTPDKGVPVSFINDMEAIGYDIFFGDGEDKLEKLYDSKQEVAPQERRALMLVSGGLGQALWYWDKHEKRLSPISSEGGHADFAPSTPTEVQLWSYLKQENEAVSYELLLSNPGLVRICKFLESTEDYGNQNLDNADAIIQQALQGTPLCKKALKMFISIWGAEAGNMALRYKAEGGVYIGGISIPIEMLKEENIFRNAFTDKEGDFKTYNEGISIKVFQEQGTVMRGAARYAIEVDGFVTKGKLAIMRENQLRAPE